MFASAMDILASSPRPMKKTLSIRAARRLQWASEAHFEVTLAVTYLGGGFLFSQPKLIVFLKF